MNTEDRAALRELLWKHEGCVLKAYDDATGLVIQPGDRIIGYPTIGVGRNLLGRGITETEADLLLSGDITDVCLELDKLIPWWVTLDSVRQIVLADMCFNMGAANVVKKWPNFMAALEQKQYGRAAQHMRQSKWCTQVGVRAVELIRMMERGALA